MIPGLDGLRAIAFFFVYFFHVDYFDAGWVGVQLFFVLSGFLITGILIDMKKSLAAGGYFIKFYGRRFLRIFPLYYFYLIAMGLLAGWLIDTNYRPGWLELFTSQVKYAYFYVANFHAVTNLHTDTYFLTHLWSLSVEEQFYITWPLVIFLTPEKHYKKLFLLLIVLGPILRIGELGFYNSGEISFLTEIPARFIYALPFSHADAFAFGAYISRYSLPKAKMQFYILLGLVPVVGFITQYLVTGDFGSISAIGHPLYMPEAYQFIWGYSLLNYFFAITIYAVAKEGLFVRFLEWKPLRYLGKISYGLYVYHHPVIWFVRDIRDLNIVDETNLKPAIAILALLVTMIIASASYYILERPILHKKDVYFPIR